MIYVDRSALKVPAVLTSSKAQKAFVVAKEFYARPLNSRLQEHPEFRAEIWNEAKPVLTQLFHGKCAYCETEIAASGVSEIDMFRPKAGSLNDDGSFAPDHYWWLTYEWFNLYLSCRQCNRHKGSRFPVKGLRVKVPKGAKAQLGASWYVKDLKTEKPFLLDPCEKGFNPDQHFVFDPETGVVAGLTTRGKVSIEVFDLNRGDLLRKRQYRLKQVVTLVNMLAPGANLGPPIEALKQAQNAAGEFAAAQRQVIRRLLLERRKVPEVRRALTDLGIIDVRKPLRRPSHLYVQSEQVRKIVSTSRSEKIAREKQKAERAGLNPQYITRIEIHNFRVIKDLDLSFPPPDQDEKSWTVLLGENGVGKSSILKAVALALQDKEYLSSGVLDPATILRSGTRKGYVRVHMTDYSKPFEVLFDNKTFQKTNDNQLQTYVFGYGSTRLLPHSDYKPALTKGVVRTENLFDPFLPLVNARSWMLSLGSRSFGYTALALKDLLLRKKNDRLFRRKGKIKLRLGEFESSVPLELLSDGYQSMVALTADILKVMLETWPTADKAQGIVLLDEIDVHLHPRWKVEVVNRLRRTFPYVQFLVTTHDPLCLMGTQPGEVHVLERDDATGELTATQFDVPPGTTADRVLTGFWFGLPSTTDSGTLRMLQDYYRLQRARRTPTNQTRLHHLQEELRSRLGAFADTSIDRIAQSVAADVIRGRYQSWNLKRREQAHSEIKAKVVRRLERRG
jgi:uncharacterized protein (TIGR02646 family)